MQLQTVEFPFTLLTPCFSGSALGRRADRAEMRIPPIRGHVRFWHRALFGFEDCNRVWGSAGERESHGSRVALRLVNQVASGECRARLLPHDPKKSGRERPAVAPGQSFTLGLQRLPGCTDMEWDHAQRAMKLWLLVGGLGLRSSRAAGSVWPGGEWVPRTRDDFKKALEGIDLRGWSVALIGLEVDKSADELRQTASDTLQGNPYTAIFGGIRPRAPSPTRFKVAQLAREKDGTPGPCLVAVAPHLKLDLNGATQTILAHAKELLRGKPNPDRWSALGEWDFILP